MAKNDYDVLKKIAYDRVNESVVSPSEFLTLPGKTIEDFIDGLLDFDFDTSMMSAEDIINLREYLRQAVYDSVEENKKE